LNLASFTTKTFVAQATIEEKQLSHDRPEARRKRFFMKDQKKGEKGFTLETRSKETKVFTLETRRKEKKVLH
jgi:hypothetical protein